MGRLATLIALGWFWLLFYGVGPLTSTGQIVAGAATLLAGTLVSAGIGFVIATRRTPSVRPGRR